MSSKMQKGPALIVVLSDGIRGHLFQSLGIARWISFITGADVVELSVPIFKGFERFWLMKVLSRFLPKCDHLGARRWLEWAGASDLIESYRDELLTRGLRGDDCLVVSAGSSAAPFNLALSRLMRSKNVVLMTPSVLGNSPFNWAIAPSHDCNEKRDNLLETLGAPNSIYDERLDEDSSSMVLSYPPSEDVTQSWGVLVGGDDQNYKLDPMWAEMTVGVLVRIAEEQKVDLYITTSRRTAPETEKKIAHMCSSSDRVKMLIIASRDDSNPVPGILGHCDRIFATEDSVSMISEAVTSSSEVFLLRTGRQKGWRRVLQEITLKLVTWKAIPEKYLWGTPRFDRMLEDFKGKGLIKEMPLDVVVWRKILGRPVSAQPKFNEAERAAKWILEGWSR